MEATMSELFSYISELERENVQLRDELTHIRHLVMKEKEEHQKQIDALLNDMASYFNRE
jgi:hypothetical protein